MARPNVGDVVQIALPNGRYAYGRVLRDAAVAFYRSLSDEPAQPPIGSRDFQFVVGVYDDVVSSWPVVGRDPSSSPEDDWPPPSKVQDVITKQFRIYHKGEMRPSTEDESRHLETAAVRDHDHIIRRLMAVATAN